jgi:hypothetical protein
MAAEYDVPETIKGLVRSGGPNKQILEQDNLVVIALPLDR